MNRKELGPVLTVGQLSRLRSLLATYERSRHMLVLAGPTCLQLLRDIDAENADETVLVERTDLIAKPEQEGTPND